MNLLQCFSIQLSDPSVFKIVQEWLDKGFRLRTVIKGGPNDDYVLCIVEQVVLP